MKQFLLTLLLIAVGHGAFALPGNRVNHNDPNLISACSVEPETISTFSLNSLGNLIACNQFDNDQYVEYCECMERVYGKAIEEHEEYERFVESLQIFDHQESRIEDFVKDSETVILASLANFLASKIPGGSEPFLDGGACSERFKETESHLNELFVVPQKLEILSSILVESRDSHYLASQGIDESTIESHLNSIFTLQQSTGVGNRDILNNLNTSSQNETLQLLGQSIDSIRNRNTHINEESGRHLSSSENGTTFGVSIEVALEGVCENLAKRFESSRTTQDAEVPPAGEMMDVASSISEKHLNPADMRAFRGLKARFLNSNVLDSEGQNLFFGQYMCANLDRESFVEVEGSSDTRVSALSNDQLRDEIGNNNALLRVTLGEYEAAYLQFEASEEFSEEKYAEIEQVIREMGLSIEEFKGAFSKVENEDDLLRLVDEFVANGSFTSAQELNLLSKIQELYSANIELESKYDSYQRFQSLVHNTQMANNEVFRELASRVGVQTAYNIVGVVDASSASSNFFERFFYDEDLIGPIISDGMRFGGELNESEVGSVSTLLEQERLDQLRGDQALETLLSSPDLDEIDRTGLTEAVREAQERIHTQSRIRDFVEGRSSARKISGVPKSLQEKPFEKSLSRKILSPDSKYSQEVPPVERSIVDSNNTTTSSLATRTAAISTDSSGIFATVTPRALENNSDALEIRSSTSRDSVSRDLGISEEITSETSDRISELSERVDREILEAQKIADDEDPSRLNTLKRFESELETLKRKNESLRSELNGDSPIIPSVATPRASSRVVVGTSSVGRSVASAEIVSAVETPAQQASAVVGAPTQAVITGPNSAYESINNQVNSALGIGDQVDGNTVSTESIQLNFSRVSSLSDSTAVEAIAENFLSLTNDQKLAYVEKFFAERGGSEAYIQQEDGTIVFIQLEKKAGLSSRDEISAAVASELVKDSRRSLTRVGHLENLFSQFFEE